MATSRIKPTIDYNKDGKQTGFLMCPHSVHESAYGWLPIPVVCIKNGDGPTVLLSAGNHGDEYEGQVALSKLIRALDAEQVRGRIIFLPAANFPAAMAGRRTSPLDMGNLNRSFPGDPEGGPTKEIAHYIESELLPLCDYAFDLHSGGSSLMYVTSTLGVLLPGETERNRKTLELMREFGAPAGCVMPANLAAGQTFAGAAIRRGVIALGSEMGGSGAVTPAALKACEAGVRRVLKYLGVVPDMQVEASPGTRLMEVRGADYFVFTPEFGGVFEPLADIGDEVKAGQSAAAIHFIHTPWREPATVQFDHDGLILCKRYPGRTERGDCLFHLATDYRG